MNIHNNKTSKYIPLNTFTSNHIYFRPYRERLLPPLQMQLSGKPKIFCCIFIAFLESTLTF